MATLINPRSEPETRRWS